MRPFSYFCIPLFGAVLLLASCESTQQKRVVPAPPAQAQAPALAAPASEPAHASQSQRKSAVTQPDAVDAAIAAVEREYQAGQANYKAGHLEAAKNNFDRAFDLLLQSPGDVRQDDRLQREFDKIVEEVNQLELQALKQGDGFTETSVEPAPIDEANEVTFPVDPKIMAQAEAELKTTQSDLPLVLNNTVAAYINYFSSRGRSSLEYGYVRSGRYRDMILKTLKEEGVPQDLIYLAQAESGFRPLALSRAGARGMWQFMAGSGVNYGLKRSWWSDDRQDPIRATRAAARYLKDLHNQFGDWYLAMAAYNSGAGTVQRAVERTGYADFWELHRRGALPGETRNYVPIILAITIMSKNPAQYGLEHLRPDPPLKSETVKIDYPVDLRLVAECVDSSVSTLQELNPNLLRLNTPKDQTFDLHVPAGTVEKFRTAIAAIPPDMRVSWHYHRVRSGDTLGSIARKYHTTAEAIQKVNGLEKDDLRLESKLIIPSTPGRQSTSDTSSTTTRATRYKVHKGDTILSVADHFNVSPASLRKWNRVKGNSLKAGRSLTIYRTVSRDTTETASRGRKSAKAEQDESEEDTTAVAKSGRGRVERVASRSKSKARADKAEDEEEVTSASRSRKGRAERTASRSKRGRADKAEDEDETTTASKSKNGRTKRTVSRGKKAQQDDEEDVSASKSSRGRKQRAATRGKKDKDTEEQVASTRKTKRGKKAEAEDSEPKARKGKRGQEADADSSASKRKRGSKIKAAKAEDEDTSASKSGKHSKTAKSSKSTKTASGSGGETTRHRRRAAR